MRVSTSEMYRMGLNNLSRQQNLLLEIQSHISSGKRISQPSDDPISTAKTVLIRHELSQTQRFLGNIDSARNHLQEEETLFDGMADNLQRVRELYIQMNSSALSVADRKMIADEIEVQLGGLESLANFQDNSGQYLFAGFQNLVKPITKDSAGNYLYNGDEGQQFLQISTSLQLPISDSGADVFANIPSGNGYFAISAGASPNQGNVLISSGQMMDPGQYIADDYALTFVDQNGMMTYEITDSQGSIVTSGPFSAGSDLSFNGISLHLSGTAQNGDQFLIEPSHGINLFNSIHSVTQACRSANQTLAGQASYQNALNRGLIELDGALNQLNQIRAQVGARLNTLDSNQSINEDFSLHSESLLSLIEDVDMADAAVQLSAQTAALQAAQQSFVKIQNLSIFNFL